VTSTGADPPVRSRRDAFEALTMPLLPLLAGTAHRLLGGSSSVPDLVQETLLRAYRTFDSFVPGTHARVWLLTHLHSTFDSAFRDRVRERNARSIEECEARYDLALAAADPERHPESGGKPALSWSRSEIERAFDRLPEPYRTAVALVDIEELSYEEAAAVLECPVRTLSARLFGGRRALAAELAGPADDDSRAAGNDERE